MPTQTLTLLPETLLDVTTGEPVTGTRRRILEAGLASFARIGYPGTSIRDIAAGADIKPASLYAHFASKEAILAQLVRLGHEEHHRRLLAALFDAGPAPADQLAALVRAHVAGHAEFALLATVANRELRHLAPEDRAPGEALRERSFELLTTVLARGIADGAFHVIDEFCTGAAIATMGTAVAGWYPDRADRVDVDALTECYAALALRMAGAGDQG